MKTIALSDSAYERLASWKTGHGDTFSTVVERLVPAKGTVGAALGAARALPRLPDGEWRSLEAAVGATRTRIR